MKYVDMDDTIADLYGYVISKDPNVVENNNWCRIIVENYKECFLVSDVISENLYLLKGEFKLLSSLPGISEMLKYTSPDQIDEIVYTLRENKLKFAERIGVKREDVIILNKSSEKKLYAKGNILYDDYHKNINEWNANGGTGFLVPRVRYNRFN